jgi:hypothetical protein
MPRDGIGHCLRTSGETGRILVSYAEGSGFCVWDPNHASIQYDGKRQSLPVLKASSPALL